jgi:DNA polymerase V
VGRFKGAYTVQQALSLLRPTYQTGYDHTKAGVILSGLVNETAVQEDLFVSPSLGQDDWSAQLTYVINRRSLLRVRSDRQAGPAAYVMRREHSSPAYTTDWN